MRVYTLGQPDAEQYEWVAVLGPDGWTRRGWRTPKDFRISGCAFGRYWALSQAWNML